MAAILSRDRLLDVWMALSKGSAADQRAKLRKLVTRHFKEMPQSHYDECRDVAATRGTIKRPRAQPSFFRDSMPMDALIGVAAGAFKAGRTATELAYHGTNMATWCSVLVAYPVGTALPRHPPYLVREIRSLAYQVSRETIEAVQKAAGGPVEMSTLGELVNACDVVRLRTGKTTEEVINHFGKAIEIHAKYTTEEQEKYRKGIRALISLRETEPASMDDLEGKTWDAALVEVWVDNINGLTTTETEPTMTSTATATTPATEIDAKILGPLNGLLVAAGLPDVEGIRSALAKGVEAMTELKDVRAKLAASPAAAPMTLAPTVSGIPTGKTSSRKASDLFPLAPKDKAAFDFEVPFFEWDGPHPDVPAIDGDYIFRPDSLMQVLYAIVKNKRIWLHGHTGTGKTTLIEQVCARLNYPYKRINFDSEISRMDLIGRDVLTTNSEGKVESRFVDGVLPQAMSGPYFILLDEISFIKPDVSYVIQRPLEPNGVLVIAEDGGRVVQPHPYCRFGAGDNTVGQGDETGVYSGARAQSAAFINRFDLFSEIPYLSPAQERDLIVKRVSGIAKDVAQSIAKYANEHREAFKRGEILLPLSPRNTVNIAEKFMFLTAMGVDKAMSKAIDSIVIARASMSDRAVVKGIMDRVFTS